jgi:hypothetical protein
MIEHGIVHACLWEGGAWAAALSDVAQQYHAAPVLLAVHMYAVQPLLFRAGPGTAVAYAALLRVFVESAHPRTTIKVLRWLSHDAVTLLFATGAALLAAVLERGQQRRFVSACMHAARAAQA